MHFRSTAINAHYQKEMSLVGRKRIGRWFQPILLLLFVIEANTESGQDVTSGDDEPIQDDENLDTADYDVFYSKLVLCAILFLVTLGPVVIYFYSFSYSPKKRVSQSHIHVILDFVLGVCALHYWLLCNPLQLSVKHSLHHPFISTDMYAFLLAHYSH